jgi:ribosomal protein L27
MAVGGVERRVADRNTRVQRGTAVAPGYHAGCCSDSSLFPDRENVNELPLFGKF